MKVESEFVPDNYTVEEALSEVEAKGCGKGHECVRKKCKDPLSNEATKLVNKAIAGCLDRKGGFNVCCAHDPVAIDLLQEQLGLLQEEDTGEMIAFLENHKELMQTLDGVRIAFETGGDPQDEAKNFNDFLAENLDVYLSDSDLGALFFRDGFMEGITRDQLVGAIKVREMILGKKVEKIRDFVLEHMESDDYAY